MGGSMARPDTEPRLAARIIVAIRFIGHLPLLDRPSVETGKEVVGLTRVKVMAGVRLIMYLFEFWFPGKPQASL
jgi:hypothetical protein